MSIETEVIAAVKPAIDEAFAKPVPLDPADVDMIRGLIARVQSLEMIVKLQDKAIGALQATAAKL